MEAPFQRGSATCISCGTCTTICPTGAITLNEIDEVESFHELEGLGAGTTCKVCAAFELAPKPPDDYAGWLAEKTSTGPVK